MNLNDPAYSWHQLVHEMMETPGIVRQFNPLRAAHLNNQIKNAGRLLFTGEGSSRIFPAKLAIWRSFIWNSPVFAHAEGSRQAMEYDLVGGVVFCASNSGKTRETLSLAQKLAATGHPAFYGLTANTGTPLSDLCRETFVLQCGWEAAVAATKSVVEQALFCDALIWNLCAKNMEPELARCANALEAALSMKVDPSIVQAMLKAPTVYFAGANTGVAEELTLKTNEIVRHKSDFLEGTYAVHGIEEVMEANDILFWIDPLQEEADKFQDVLVKGVGMRVIAIADHPTSFETIMVPEAGAMKPYVLLAAGWNLLVEAGLAAGVALDRTMRARKVGNEFKNP